MPPSTLSGSPARIICCIFLSAENNRIGRCTHGEHKGEVSRDRQNTVEGGWPSDANAAIIGKKVVMVALLVISKKISTAAMANKITNNGCA